MKTETILCPIIGLVATLFLPFLDLGKPVLVQAINMSHWIHNQGYPWWVQLLNPYAIATIVVVTAFGCIPSLFWKRRQKPASCFRPSPLF